jgi:hypothetical protein
MALPRKVFVLMGIGGLLFLVSAWQYLSFWLSYGYSRGSRTGILRKVSVKGPPYCKYLEGELALQGGNPGQMVETFTFTVDDHSESNPLVLELKKAERDGARVTLDYRQDKHLWWRCNAGGKAGSGEFPNSQYYAIKVER